MGTLNPDLLTREVNEIFNDAAVLKDQYRKLTLIPELVLLAFILRSNTSATQLLDKFKSIQKFELEKFEQQVRLAVEGRNDPNGNLDFVAQNNRQVPLSKQTIIVLDDALTFANSRDSVRIDVDHIFFTLADQSFSTAGLLGNAGITKPIIAEAIGQIPETSHRKKLIGAQNVFISYRRADNIHACGRIYDRLIAVFGEKRVFRDLDNIPLGADFRKIINDSMTTCEIVLVIVGKKWLRITDEDGKKRLENPADFVRVEIEAALSHNILIIPVLIDNARMPRADELPESLKDIAYRNAISIRTDPDFHRDVNKLIEGMRQHFKSLE